MKTPAKKNRHSPLVRFWHLMRARPRLMMSVLAGALTINVAASLLG